MVRSCPNEAAVAETVSTHVKRLLEVEQARPEALCVVAGTHRELEEYRNHLKQVCSAIHQIETGKAEDSTVPGLRMATVWMRGRSEN